MKKRNLVIGLLIMLSVIVSGFTFAFWQGTIDLNETESTSITIGSGREVLVTADLTEFNVVSLVPVGKEDLSNENNAASSVVLTYTLNYADSAAYATNTTFTTVLQSVSLNGMSPERIDYLFDFVVKVDGTDYNVTYDDVNDEWGIKDDLNNVWLNPPTGSITKTVAETITITVTFANEPADADEYDLVATKALTFNVVFTTAQVMNP